MMAILGLGELVFLIIEVIGRLLFGIRAKRVPPLMEHEIAGDSHAVPISAASSARE